VIWLVVVLVVVVVAAAVLVQLQRKRRRADGVAGFQRHMSALSSDARRDVISRVEAATVETSPGSEVDPQADPGIEG
jgi:hypothetical protein